MNTNPHEAIINQQATDWDSVLAEINAWRGACLHHCSAVEMAVTETLFALSAAMPGHTEIGLRHLVGQRLEDLASALAPGGAFDEVGKSAQRELTQYRQEHEAFRNLICHGVLKATVERNGQWMLIVRMLAIRARQAERSTLALDRGEALAKLDALKRDGQRLTSVLGQLRRTVG